MSSWRSTSLLLIFIIFSFGASAQNTNGLASSVVDKLRGWLSAHEPINIYGRVVDQFDAPVVGAEVIIAWRQFTLDLDIKVKSASVTTDANGTFSCRIYSGVWPIIRSLERDGYELIRDQNPVMKLHLEKQQDILAVTTPSNPVVLKLRKKGEATFLLKRDFILLDATARSNELDHVDLVFMRRELNSDTQVYKDLQTEVSYIQSNNSWVVTYRATNNTDGLIVSEEVLYEAPETGYQKEVVITNPTRLVHIYLRSRNPVIFSRIDAVHRNWRLDPFPEYRITVDILTNPYGSRNLEYDVRYEKYWRIKERLVKETKSYLANKQYPPVPNLEELIAQEPP